MKKTFYRFSAAVLLLIFLLASGPIQPSAAQATQPLLYIYSYSPGPNSAVSPWAPFDFTFVISNNSPAAAKNVVMTFSSEDFIPLDGGVFTLNDIQLDDKPGTTLRFRVSDYSSWKYSGVINATATYTDDAGTSYTSSFVFYIAIAQSAVVSPTQTPTSGPATKPQLVISGYSTDVDPLQPGSSFKLKLKITNAGVADASNVSLVYGGGVSLSPNEQGTPQPGISGSTGDLTNFAPVGSSNVALLGDLPVGASVETEQQFVVNVSTVPGAYPLKVSLVYTAPGGTRAVDDQLITLLVYALPQLEISFYRDPGMFFNGMMTALPIQITNLSRKTTVLGNMTVSSENADLQNNTGLVGTLDPGGYFTWDVMYTPFGEGPTKINITINYTDDFNQLRVYESALDIEVQPPMEIPEEPIPGEGEMPVEPEQPVGFWAKIWNAIKGFLGIGTGSSIEQPIEMPMEEGFKNVP
ncbi:MAG: hypothetical protein GYA40_05060 [Chloroflexi bacterium]|nr:hypothetical protein [Chloroflexota bacterium]